MAIIIKNVEYVVSDTGLVEANSTNQTFEVDINDSIASTANTTVRIVDGEENDTP